MGSNSSNICECHQFCLDFDHTTFVDKDTDAFDEILQQIRGSTTSDGDEASEDQLLAKIVVERFLLYHVKKGKRETTSSTINLLGFSSIPKKKRGGRGGKRSRYYYDGAFTTSSRGGSCGRRITSTKKRKNKPRLQGDHQKAVDFKKLGLDQLDFSNEIKSIVSWHEGVDKDFKLRITKVLYNTDTSPHHDRFSMPMRQIIDYEGFLTADEKKEVAKPKGETEGVEVKLLVLPKAANAAPGDGMGESIRLRRWDMTSSSYYVLTTSWNSVVARNKQVLRAQNIFQVYSFRRNEQLCLVLVKVSDGKGCRDGAFGSRRDHDIDNTADGDQGHEGDGASGREQFAWKH